VEREYDAVIIGSGPGGEGAAMQCAKSGRSVVVVERYDQVGGGCTHWGTIPSKALRRAIQQFISARQSPLLREALRHVPADLPSLVKTASAVVASQVELRQSFYDRNHVEVVRGQARFLDPHSVEVTGPDGSATRLRGQHFVIAVGSRPYRPSDVDFTHACMLDSDTILDLQRTPQSLTVYGAGVVGCEYASMLRGLGIKVNLVNTRKKLLSHLDDEIIDALSYHLREQGVLVRHDEEYERVEPIDDHTVVLHLKSGKQIRSDAILWANGRTGNTDGLGLEAIGLSADVRGNLPVDRHYCTTQPHIYAVGDVTGPPALASAAYDQGRFAARHLVDPTSEHALASFIPTGIYTTPEISCVGRNERDLTADHVPYEVGRSLFKSLARAQITGQTVGMLKLLFHRETRQILGVHCFGYQAAEIVHIGQAIMAQAGHANTLDYFIDTTFNYPTMAEAYRVAALNGLNRL
jgi:NAD(P) transhydrogenase